MNKAERLAIADDQIERIRAREIERHKQRMEGIDRMAKRLRSGSAKGITARDEALLRLCELSDEYTAQSTEGRFNDSASREWKSIPLNWRANMLLRAGLGVGLDSLDVLASRNWYEMPPPERSAISKQVRDAKQYFKGLMALTARV
ncbi:hypothetical protein [Diaphorobacter caeni]|uniref:hypothetical protein n=1 Tax=Diaphorobacter caeni TaxID=2784387 RepID=UPI00189049E6|nr:hypothetical protein [Diaphorobacter caeni]MBF5006972.1 hypothetical protein [Diaphorobacter caeni]